MELLDATGAPIFHVSSALQHDWWSQRHQCVTSRRPWFAQLYPPDIPLDWPLSNGIFRRPVISGGSFTHRAPPATIKWIARLRSGCLATGLRRHTHLPTQVPSSACLCCGAELEDDRHAVAGCPATGASDWHLNIAEAWGTAAHSCNLIVPLPSEDWMELHHLPLLAALIPLSLCPELPLPPEEGSRFLFRLHLLLAQRTAEIFRCRQELMENTTTPIPSTIHISSLVRRCPLPPERQLSVPDFRQLESQRRVPVSTLVSGPVALPPSSQSTVPVAPTPLPSAQPVVNLGDVG